MTPVQVTVQNPEGGGTSNAVSFTITVAPTITTLTPSSVNAPAPDTVVAIVGNGFYSDTRVLWTAAGTTTTLPASNVVYQSATQLQVTIPSNLLQAPPSDMKPVQVTLQNPEGGGPSNAVNFTIVPPTPTIASLSPNAVTAPAPNTVVSIVGTGFYSDAQVLWTAAGTTTTVPAANIVFQSATQLQVTIPATLLQAPPTDGNPVQVTVQNPEGGGPSNVANFTIFSPVVIQPVTTPIVVGLTTSTPVTLRGSGFPCSQTKVLFTVGSNVQQFSGSSITSCSATALTFVIPQGALTHSGTASVAVQNAATGASSSPVTVTLSDPTFATPTLQISPISGSSSNQDQVSVSVTIPQANVAGYTGTLQLSFQPDPSVASISSVPGGYSDPAMQFVMGDASDPKGRTLSFTIPACASAPCTNAVALPANGAFSEGGVAGTVSVNLSKIVYAGDNTDITSSVCPSGCPVAKKTIAAAAPVITAGSVQITNLTSTGFTVVLQGMTNTRELGNAIYTFSAATGATLNGSQQFATAPIAIGSVAATEWFGTSTALNYPGGGGFSLGMAFTYSGDPAAIGSVSVTLSNSQGTSQAVSGTKSQ
jgi:hypothetical protein